MQDCKTSTVTVLKDIQRVKNKKNPEATVRIGKLKHFRKKKYIK